jgi:hypothetical protein
MIRRLGKVVLGGAAIVWAAAVAGCPGEVPAGGACSSTGECEDGLQCLYPLGSGCSAKGQCDVPTTDCAGTAVGLIVCGCGAPVDFGCIPASATLAVQTATGSACLLDAGDAGDARDASDAGDAGP